MADDRMNVGLESETDYEDPELSGNGPTPAPEVLLSGSNCDQFTFVLYVFVLGALCLFGLVGNTLAFLVLRSERRGHVATFLLQTMAVADNLFLTTTALSLMTMELTISADVDEKSLVNLYTLTAYVQVYVWPLVHISQMWTVWITVLLAFNRYVAICRPFQAIRICTMRQSRLQVLVSAVSIIVYNIPRFLEHRLELSYDQQQDLQASSVNSSVNSSTALSVMSSNPSRGMLPPAAAIQTDLKRNLIYNIVYENVLYCFFVFLGPLVILIVLNAGLIRELCLARRRLRERNLPASVIGPEQGEQNLTLVMIIIVVIFLVCQTPAFVNQLVYVIGVEDSCGVPYYYYYHLSNIFVSANSAVNFVVYCVFRRQFRRRLRDFCGCGGAGDDRRQQHIDRLTTLVDTSVVNRPKREENLTLVTF